MISGLSKYNNEYIEGLIFGHTLFKEFFYLDSKTACKALGLPIDKQLKYPCKNKVDDFQKTLHKKRINYFNNYYKEIHDFDEKLFMHAATQYTLTFQFNPYQHLLNDAIQFGKFFSEMCTYMVHEKKCPAILPDLILLKYVQLKQALLFEEYSQLKKIKIKIKNKDDFDTLILYPNNLIYIQQFSFDVIRFLDSNLEDLYKAKEEICNYIFFKSNEEIKIMKINNISYDLLKLCTGDSLKSIIKNLKTIYKDVTTKEVISAANNFIDCNILYLEKI